MLGDERLGRTNGEFELDGPDPITLTLKKNGFEDHDLTVRRGGTGDYLGKLKPIPAHRAPPPVRRTTPVPETPKPAAQAQAPLPPTLPAAKPADPPPPMKRQSRDLMNPFPGDK
jgi:hypothetical protein